VYDPSRSFWNNHPSISSVIVAVLKSEGFIYFVGLLLFLIVIIFGIQRYITRMKNFDEELGSSIPLQKNPFATKNEFSNIIESKKEDVSQIIKPEKLETIKVEEPKIVKEEAIKKKRPVVNINVDLDKRFFHKNQLNKHEVDYLLRKGYQIRRYKSLLSNEMEDFLLLPRHNESCMHHFMVYNISEFLEENGIKVERYTTVKPDIVFTLKDKRFAIEVETGSIFSKVSRMKEKLRVLEKYEEWFFVVTKRDKVKKYKEYGDAVDKRYVGLRLQNLLKHAKKG